jgi:hypothetical protein
VPLVKPDLEFVFGLKAKLGPPVVVGDTPEGLRRMIPILGGSFAGRGFEGDVLGGGADWQFVRPDEVTVAEAVYLLRMRDGTLIQVRNRGLRHGPRDVIERLGAGEDVDAGEYYFRSAPILTAPAGAHEWVNRAVWIATGARFAAAIELWFYRAT